jgi:UDP-glucuronate decarboxylase
MKNIEPYLNNEAFSFVEHDVIEPLHIQQDVDFIYNLASPASPPMYQQDPVHTFMTNVWGSYNLLELARQKRARILLASTSEVYGDPLVSPQSETYWGNVNPNGLRSCYDEGKRAAETLFCDYQREYNVDTRIVRIFNTYGPNMRADDGRVVSNFITQALSGKRLTIHGDGTQTRAFQYVDDLVEGLIRVMGDEVPHTPINLGNPHEVSVNELATMIQELLGAEVELEFDSLPSDDPRRRCPDITTATSLLDGWVPNVSLEEGLARTIDYFKKVI